MKLLKTKPINYAKIYLMIEKINSSAVNLKQQDNTKYEKNMDLYNIKMKAKELFFLFQSNNLEVESIIKFNK